MAFIRALGRFFVISLGNLFFQSREQPLTIEQRQRIRRILVILPVGIGDVIMATPALRALRQAFPHATIDALCNRWSEDILEGNPHLNRLIVHDSLYGNHSLLHLYREAKSYKGYDCAVIFSYFTLPLFAFFCGCKIRVGPFMESEGFALTHKTRFYSGLHVVDLFLRVVGLLGARTDDTHLELFDDHPQKKNDRLVGLCVGGGKNPLSTLVQKKWPTASYAELCRSLLDRKFTLVFLGGKDDLQDTEEVISLLPSSQKKIVNCVGATTLKEAASILSGCRVFISGDSALMHLAAAVGTPTLSLFGPTDPHMLAPRGKNHLFLASSTRCPGCQPPSYEFVAICRNGGHILDISVSDVVEKLRVLL